jgi:Asp-tRNA(Asn)/Glu-tRNA(Gln) amidotransferase B subunit
MAAWNLPDIEAQLVGNLNIGSKMRWFTSFHFLGSRPGAYRPVLLLQDPAVNQAELKNISSVSFIKSEVSYQIYEQWNVFVRYRSVFGDTPYQWDFTPLNQNMLLLGARYKINVNL